MRSARASLALLALPTVILVGCVTEERLEDGLFTAEEWAIVQTLSPLPPPELDPTNRYDGDDRVARFGQKLFFDADYSGPLKVGDNGQNGGLGKVNEEGKIACASCHIPDDWFIDTRSNPRSTSLGVDWHFRNAPTLVNVATYQKQFGWAGQDDNLWGKNITPPEMQMGTDRSSVVHHLYARYRREYNELFDPDLDPALDPDHLNAHRFPRPATPLDADSYWDQMDPQDQHHINTAYANFGKAIAAYERLLVSDDAPFDRYVAGDTDAISEPAKRGLKLFIGKAACVACHEGPTFSDEQFHVTGVPQIGEHVPDHDWGRYGAIPFYLGWDFNTAGEFNDDPSIDRTEGVKQENALRGAFRTKGLRNVAMTGPFLHTGHLDTLEEVVELYNQGGAESGFAGVKDPKLKPLNLTQQEVEDLVVFLETLTGQPIPEELRRPPADPRAKY